MSLIEDAVEAAKKAVQFDQEGKTEASIYYYEAASALLERAATSLDSDKAKSFKTKSNEYKNRALELQNARNTDHKVESDTNKQQLQKGYFLLQEAIEEDESGDKSDAIELYAQAIEFITKNPDLMQGELKQLALQALERAEALKGIKHEPKVGRTPVRAKPDLHRGSSAHLQVTGADSYTPEEKAVLCHTSNINSREYVPFMTVDLTEKFQYSIPFTDKDGFLALSPKQKREFSSWVRPQDLCTEPCIVDGAAPNYLNIKQTVISDCSFVASLAVSALYEKKFGRKLVTAIIYPQRRDKQPRYNPFGKYMIKLHVNGVARKVIIDDYLPINRYGQLLCSYSSNKREFWISLLEKAYMKVMGGYDFPGSNSNIDLHALTGWIPERTAIRKNDPDFNKDALFSTLESRLAKGDVLVTVATGELSDADAERSGLVPTHAYAVMDVRTVDGVRLLKLKNPWSHLRWRGRYSELDIKRWTPELQRELQYDPSGAAQFDNGVFWIDYESLCAFFDVFYMNWNPELFKYTFCIHQSWNAGTGPVKDLYTIGSNPQFSLDVSSNAGAVWLLLTRHITDIDDFRENQEYITVLVYKNDGKRVYYPYDPPPYIDGVKINSPHYLCKIILSPGSSTKYTIVISQYEKTSTIYYTLRAYATCPFTLRKIADPFKYEQEITGEWRGLTAGGCPNHPLTFKNNPKFRLEIEGSSNRVFIELKGPKQYQIGIEVVILKVSDDSVTAPFRSKSSGAYRSGYVILELENIPAGVLQIVPSTFLPSQEGPFFLLVKASAPIQLTKF
ncbi:calpain-7 [Tribolium castaneum]|uniref:Calpain-7-like Protein n=1 Tax=Tribolium castaneum TaxID=7070 RepID=D6WYV7_TRICA|nr:PREDICTED: calpain-7 [Tribolium castaneum]EFA09011.1 Calpain-7-like Protein [Tribolium castaneum]|eukprot:XP_967682.1 PREDICTED: calpain-7 [Tribolium castaneum]